MRPVRDEPPSLRSLGWATLAALIVAGVILMTVVLPAEVDQSQSHARFENGVLTLTLAKKVPAGATQLSIA